jgi:hypothetical protein
MQEKFSAFPESKYAKTAWQQVAGECNGDAWQEASMPGY